MINKVYRLQLLIISLSFFLIPSILLAAADGQVIGAMVMPEAVVFNLEKEIGQKIEQIEQGFEKDKIFDFVAPPVFNLKIGGKGVGGLFKDDPSFFDENQRVRKDINKNFKQEKPRKKDFFNNPIKDKGSISISTREIIETEKNMKEMVKKYLGGEYKFYEEPNQAINENQIRNGDNIARVHIDGMLFNGKDGSEDSDRYHKIFAKLYPQRKDVDGKELIDSEMSDWIIRAMHNPGSGEKGVKNGKKRTGTKHSTKKEKKKRVRKVIKGKIVSKEPYRGTLQEKCVLQNVTKNSIAFLDSELKFMDWVFKNYKITKKFVESCEDCGLMPFELANKEEEMYKLSDDVLRNVGHKLHQLLPLNFTDKEAEKIYKQYPKKDYVILSRDHVLKLFEYIKLEKKVSKRKGRMYVTQEAKKHLNNKNKIFKQRKLKLVNLKEGRRKKLENLFCEYLDDIVAPIKSLCVNRGFSKNKKILRRGSSDGYGSSRYGWDIYGTKTANVYVAVLHFKASATLAVVFTDLFTGCYLPASNCYNTEDDQFAIQVLVDLSKNTEEEVKERLKKVYKKSKKSLEFRDGGGVVIGSNCDVQNRDSLSYKFGSKKRIEVEVFNGIKELKSTLDDLEKDISEKMDGVASNKIWQVGLQSENRDWLKVMQNDEQEEIDKIKMVQEDEQEEVVIHDSAYLQRCLTRCKDSILSLFCCQCDHKKKDQ